MRRKIWISSTLLALAVLLTSASFADSVQITLGPSTGSITVGPNGVDFNNVSGIAWLGNSQSGSQGTYAIGDGKHPIGSTMPVDLSVTIGPSNMNGMMTLKEVPIEFTGGPIYIFYGTFDPTAAKGPMLKGFSINVPVEIDFTVRDGTVSSGELQILSIPEPGTIGLVGTGLLAIAGLLRRKL